MAFFGEMVQAKHIRDGKALFLFWHIQTIYKLIDPQALIPELLVDTFQVSACCSLAFLIWVPDALTDIGCKSFRSRSGTWLG